MREYPSETSFSPAAASHLEYADQGILGAIVCPLITAELPQALANLTLWDRHLQPGQAFPDRPDIVKPALVFSFNGRENSTIRDQLNTQFRSCIAVQASFSRLIVHFCDLPPEKDLYIRKPKGRAPKLGNKSGPNWQFYETMRFMRDKASFVLLMEVDCQPLQPGWLEPLARTCQGNPDAWVIGAHYSGASPLPWNIARHINGNALYQVGSEKFWTFIDKTLWPWMHFYIEKHDPDLAYDCAWEVFLNRDEMAYGGHPDWIVSRDIMHRFKLTETIVNIGGYAEQTGLYVWSRNDLIRRFAGAAIAHGPLADSARHIHGDIAVGKPQSPGVAEHGPNWVRFASGQDERRYKRSVWVPGRGFVAGDLLSIQAVIEAPPERVAVIEVHDPNGILLRHAVLSAGRSWVDPLIELALTAGHSFLTITVYIPGIDPEGPSIAVKDFAVTLSGGGASRPTHLHDFFW